MKAIRITEPGGPEVLAWQEVSTPKPGANELLVAVRATAVNRLDLLQTMGLYAVPADSPQDIPGVEYAGVVEAVGARVTNWKPGDRVFGLVGGGAYAESLVVHEELALPIPKCLSFAHAAAIPEAYITAFDAVILQGRLEAGQSVLIDAVGSGVGSAAVQLCVAHGAQVIGTARSEKKIDLARQIGLHHGIVVQGPKFAEHVMALTEGGGVNLVLELAGGSYVGESMRCMAARGRMIVVGLLSGSQAELDLAVLLRKRLEMRGTVMRSRSNEEKSLVTKEFRAHVLPLIAEGKVTPVIDRIMPLADAAEAHRYVAENKNFGKVVLEV